MTEAKIFSLIFGTLIEAAPDELDELDDELDDDDDEPDEEEPLEPVEVALLEPLNEAETVPRPSVPASLKAEEHVEAVLPDLIDAEPLNEQARDDEPWDS